MDNPQQPQNKPNVAQVQQTENSKQGTEIKQPSSTQYRIEIKRDLCIGAASCVAVAPETFALDDENIAIVKNPAGNPDEAILMAAQACPTKAIYLFEKDKQIWPE